MLGLTYSSDSVNRFTQYQQYLNLLKTREDLCNLCNDVLFDIGEDAISDEELNKMFNLYCNKYSVLDESPTYGNSPNPETYSMCYGEYKNKGRSPLRYVPGNFADNPMTFPVQLESSFKDYYNKKLNESVMNEENTAESVKKFEQLDLPWKKVSYSTLGGKHRPSIFIKFSMDKKETWINNIVENSRYGLFSFDHTGVLEIVSKDSSLPKFRKATLKTVDAAVSKIKEYIQKCN
jgi:hypothetical protein